jgi:hypothetical protein
VNLRVFTPRETGWRPQSINVRCASVLLIGCMAACAWLASAGTLKADQKKKWVVTVFVAGKVVPNKQFERPNEGIVFTNGFPCLRAEKASEMICIGSATSVQIDRSWTGNTAKSVALGGSTVGGSTTTTMPNASPFSVPGFGNFIGLPVPPAMFYKLVALGGGQISGTLFRPGRQWLPLSVTFELSPEQNAALGQEQAKEQQEAAARQQQIVDAKARKEAELQDRIAAWRALAVKPPLPEAARRYQVLAENAVQEKRFQDAANYYNQALNIEPFWPEGQFNLSLVDGELRNYSGASSHMRMYLELVPDAQDARQAEDKIIIWDEKAKTGVRAAKQ